MRDPRDVEEIAKLQQQVRDLERQQGHQFEEENETDFGLWDDRDDQHNPVAREPARNRFEQREQRPDLLRNLVLKIDIPEFDGKKDPNMFLDWLQTVERVFDLRDIPQNLKVKLVALKLRKYVSLWWENVKKKRA